MSILFCYKLYTQEKYQIKITKDLSKLLVNTVIPHHEWKFFGITLAATSFGYGGYFLCSNNTHDVFSSTDMGRYTME